MAVLKNTKSRDLIQEMWDHEKAHLAKFEELLVEYQVTPCPIRTHNLLLILRKSCDYLVFFDKGKNFYFQEIVTV